MNTADTFYLSTLSVYTRRCWSVMVALSLLAMATAAADTNVTDDSIDTVMELASQEQHEAAVALFERVKQQRPDTIESIHGHKVAVVHAAIGDPERHAAHCRWLIDRYRDAELATDAERSVKGYLLSPSMDDPALLEHALERTRHAVAHAEAVGEGGYILWFHGSLGMAAYRMGKQDEAVTHLEKAAAADNLYINSLALPFLAMAEHARGNPERAAEILEKAQAAAAQLPEPGTEEYLKEWTDTLTTQHALREAKQRIQGPAAE